MESSCFTVTIVRHGETDYNSSPSIKLEGDTDVSLNEKGRKQAHLVGIRLKEEKFTKAYTSHLIRAKETAECIFANSDLRPEPNLIVDERIRERGIGPSRVGTTFADWTTEALRWARETNEPPTRYDPDGIEPYADLKNRITPFIKELCKAESGEEHGDGASESNVLIVSHGLWILCFLDTLMTSPEFEFEEVGSVPREQILKKLIHNTAVTKVRIWRQLDVGGKRKFQIVVLNDQSHLETL